MRRPDAIFVLLDADADDPTILGPQLLDRARKSVPAGFPIGVVLARREYEAWFLAAYPSSRFRGLEALDFVLARRSLPPGLDVESVADCKAYVGG